MISSKEAKPDNWNKYIKYQIPKKVSVYIKCYNKEVENAHNAKSDVLTLNEIMFWIYNKSI